MISNNDIQAAIITRLKANTALVALLTTQAEIREAQWQGNEFVYPCVRVRVGPQTPPGNIQCAISRCRIVIQCFSENASSIEASDISYAVLDALHGHTFTSEDVKFTMVKITSLGEPIRRDERTWVVSLTFDSLVQSG